MVMSNEDTPVLRLPTIEETARILAQTKEIEQRIAQDAEEHAIRMQRMRHELREAEITRLAKERQHDAVLADDLYNRYYYFDTAITDKTITPAMLRLGFWARTMPGADIDIVFSSPGGEMTAGFALYDYIQQLRRAGHKITTHALGTAASMAAVLLQAGERRTMGKEAWLLIHQGSFGGRGSAGEMKDMAKWFDRLLGRIENIIIERCEQAGRDGTAAHPLTKRKLESNWERADWWISSEEALDLGLVDDVV